MREIGGYIEFERFAGEAYHSHCLALNSARNCLRYVLRKRGIKRIFLPKLDCIAVTDACSRESVEIRFYPVDKDLRPVTDGIDPKEWLYVINFYGQMGLESLSSLHEKYPKMIIDNVQAFFDQPLRGVDTLYSCRKFWGVPDGAYLYTDVEKEVDFRQDKSSMRMEYLVGRLEDNASEHYGAYHDNEEYLDHAEIMKMSAFTENMMHGIDYLGSLKKRRENFRVLFESLHEFNELSVREPFGPFAYPLLIRRGSEIRKRLQSYKIYIPTLWPNVVEDCDPKDQEYRLAADLLPIPVDQRYDIEDMKYLVSEISHVMEMCE